jgi:hypothetical protein
MGNWRTVNLRGTVSADEVPAARTRLTVNGYGDYSNWGPLAFSNGLCGLGEWLDAVINADGNLYERGYSVDDVAEALRELVEIAPSLALKVHCGGEYEDTECVATITVAGGVVTVGAPEVREVKPIGEDAALGRLFRAIHKAP